MREQNTDVTDLMDVTDLTIIKLKAEIFDLMGQRDNTQIIINQKFAELQKILNK